MDIRDMASAPSDELGFWDEQRHQRFSPRQREARQFIRTRF